MSTDHALEALCFLCECAPMTTTITEIHIETAGAEPIGFIGHTASNSAESCPIKVVPPIFSDFCVGAPQGTGTLTFLSFDFYLAIQSKGVVKEVMPRGSATPGWNPPRALQCDCDRDRKKNLHKAAVLAFLFLLTSCQLRASSRFTAQSPR
jgi:hypothetical protein